MSQELKEVEKRLRGVEINVAELCVEFKNHNKTMSTLVTKHDVEIYGNGRDGLKTSQDRLEVAAKKRSKLLWVFFSGVVGLVVKLVYETVTIWF